MAALQLFHVAFVTAGRVVDLGVSAFHVALIGTVMWTYAWRFQGRKARIYVLGSRLFSSIDRYLVLLLRLFRSQARRLHSPLLLLTYPHLPHYRQAQHPCSHSQRPFLPLVPDSRMPLLHLHTPLKLY